MTPHCASSPAFDTDNADRHLPAEPENAPLEVLEPGYVRLSTAFHPIITGRSG